MKKWFATASGSDFQEGELYRVMLYVCGAMSFENDARASNRVIFQSMKQAKKALFRRWKQPNRANPPACRSAARGAADSRSTSKKAKSISAVHSFVVPIPACVNAEGRILLGRLTSAFKFLSRPCSSHFYNGTAEEVELFLRCFDSFISSASLILSLFFQIRETAG